MNRLIKSKGLVALLLLLTLPNVTLRADVEDFVLSVRNITESAPGRLEFDLYLLDADGTQEFNFAALQLGLLFNSSIYQGGTITVSYSNSGSELDIDQQFTNAPAILSLLPGHEGRTLIMLMANSLPPEPPGAGDGTIISSTGYGTLLTHFILESTVDFAPNSRAGLEFCAGNAVDPLFPSIIYSFINGDPTQLPVVPGSDAVVEDEPLLNATLPALFNVTGGGTYCPDDVRDPVALDGSEAGIIYTLLRDNVEIDMATGTGSAISFGVQPEGIYSIDATNEAGTVTMIGSAEVIVLPLNSVLLTSGAGSDNQSLCIGSALSAITYSTTGATGIGIATGLPTGVSAVWSGDVITVSGTPTQSGTFTYTIPLTGGCGTVAATGTITVNDLPVTSAVSGENQPACRGTGYEYSVIATAGSTYEWNVPGDATIVSGQGSSLIVVNFGIISGAITVTETSSAGCAGDPVSLTVALRGCDLTADFEGSILEPCVGLPVVFSDLSSGTTENSTYSWSFGEDALPATATGAGPHSVQYSTAGPKTVTLTVTDGMVSVETKANYITVQPDNSVSPASSSPDLCLGSPLTPVTHTTTGATGIGVATGLPTGVSAVWSGNVITVSGIPTQSGTFTYTIPLTGGCGTVAATGTITVNDLPVTSAVSGENQPACRGTGYEYSVIATAGSTYEWNVPGDATIVSGQGSSLIVVNFGIISGAITVTETSDAGCAGDPVSLTVALRGCDLTADFEGSTLEPCVGSTVEFRNISSGTTENSTYSWSFGEDALPATATGAGPHSVQYITPGPKTVTLTVTDGMVSVESKTNYITVQPDNSVSPASSSPDLCLGSPLTPVTHTTTGATGIGAATGLPTGVSAVWSGDVITVSGTPTQSATFTYTIPLTGGCGTVAATGTITVNDLPVTSAVSGENQPACRGTGYEYSVIATAGSTYEWNVPGDATIVSGQGSSLIVVNFGIISGAITVTETSDAGCAGDPVSLTVALRGCDLTADFEGSTLEPCVGSTVEFRNISSGTTENSTYSWSFGEDALPATATGAGPHSVQYSTTGPKTVTLTVTDGMVSVETKTNYITVQPDNSVLLTSGAGSDDQSVCIGSALSAITYSTTGATGIGIATGLPSGVSAVWSGNVITVSGTPTQSGTFTYTIPLTGGCGTVAATGTITVNDLPVTSAVSGENQPACRGTGYEYSVIATAGSTYEWNVPGDATIVSGQGSSLIVVNFGIISGAITVTETSDAGCAGEPVSLTVALRGCDLTADFEGSTLEPCVGSTVEFRNISSGTTENSTYSWSFGEDALPATATGAGPHSVQYSTPGSKTVTLTVTDGMVSVETKTNYITVQPDNSVLLTSGAGSDNQSVCIGSPLSAITYSTTGATGIGVATGLPTGVSAVWSGDIITVSGTPTQSGTFAYTIPLTGGCGTVAATGTITSNPLPGAAGAITGEAAYTPGTTGVPYSVEPIANATTYLWSYSGTGVVIHGTGNSVTLDFSVEATPGILSVYGTNSCGNGTASSLALGASTRRLTLTSLFLEGLYSSAGRMRQASGEGAPQWPAGVADHITVELHSSSSYGTTEYSVTQVELSTEGVAMITVPAEYSGSYYITVKHRNHIETTTAEPVSFAGGAVNYSFDNRAKAYGNNLKDIAPGSGFFVIFGGDINQDGYIDPGDYAGLINDSYQYMFGYRITDLNGDGWTDPGDYPLLINNIYNYVMAILPF